MLRPPAASAMACPTHACIIAGLVSLGCSCAGMQRAATNQERELDGLVNTAVGVLGPLMILLMGGFVFVIVLALLVPIFGLNQLVR